MTGFKNDQKKTYILFHMEATHNGGDKGIQKKGRFKMVLL